MRQDLVHDNLKKKIQINKNKCGLETVAEGFQGKSDLNEAAGLGGGCPCTPFLFPAV